MGTHFYAVFPDNFLSDKIMAKIYLTLLDKMLGLSGLR
jgi:hypothetical protein